MTTWDQEVTLTGRLMVEEDEEYGHVMPFLEGEYLGSVLVKAIGVGTLRVEDAPDLGHVEITIRSKRHVPAYEVVFHRPESDGGVVRDDILFSNKDAAEERARWYRKAHYFGRKYETTVEEVMPLAR